MVIKMTKVKDVIKYLQTLDKEEMIVWQVLTRDHFEEMGIEFPEDIADAEYIFYATNSNFGDAASELACDIIRCEIEEFDEEN